MDPVISAAVAAAPWAALLGLLLAGLYAILRGTLVPRSHVDLLATQWEARLGDLEQRLVESHQREQDWRTAHERSEQARAVDAAQLGEVIPVARATLELLRALPGSAPAGAPPTIPRGIPAARERGGERGAPD